MTGMEHTVEQAARTLFLSDRGDTLPAGFPERQWDEGHAVKDDYIRRARALADAGLLAPAPLAEEWRAYDPRAGGVRMTDQAQAARTAHELAMDDPT